MTRWTHCAASACRFCHKEDNYSEWEAVCAASSGSRRHRDRRDMMAAGMPSRPLLATPHAAMVLAGITAGAGVAPPALIRPP